MKSNILATDLGIVNIKDLHRIVDDVMYVNYSSVTNISKITPYLIGCTYINK